MKNLCKAKENDSFRLTRIVNVGHSSCNSGERQQAARSRDGGRSWARPDSDGRGDGGDSGDNRDHTHRGGGGDHRAEDGGDGGDHARRDHRGGDGGDGGDHAHTDAGDSGDHTRAEAAGDGGDHTHKGAADSNQQFDAWAQETHDEAGKLKLKLSSPCVPYECVSL